MLSGFIITIQYISMTDSVQKKSCFQRLKIWFVQLSFWKKIIIIFTLNTCILLILTDAIMLVLFGKISNDIITISDTEKNQFNEVSNTQIVQVTSRMILSEIDFYANFLTQLANAYFYFSKNPQIYTPTFGDHQQYLKNTSSFSNVSYNQPAYYAFSPESTFTSLPFIDELIPQLLTSPYFLNNIQRINVFVHNNTNPSDLGARTFPATDQFLIPNVSTITDRFANIPTGNYNISSPYTDALTPNATKLQLIGLRTVFPSSDSSQQLMIEVELKKSMFQSLLDQIYYFPSATALLMQQSNTGYSFFSSPPSKTINSNISDYYALGFKRVSLDINLPNPAISVSNTIIHVSATVGLSNTYPLGQVSYVTNQTDDPIRCSIIVLAEQTEKPANDIQDFLSNESNILTGIVLSWSVIILLSTVALATVVGNYIFYNLKMLSTKMQQYIKNPNKFHDIVLELKELDLKGVLKRLSDNLIAIIQKIEVRKKQRKDRINQNYHPLSIGEPKFQERQQLNDFEIIQQIKEQVKAKVEIMNRQAAQKQKAERQKKKAEQEIKSENEKHSEKDKKSEKNKTQYNKQQKNKITEKDKLSQNKDEKEKKEEKDKKQ